MACPCRSPLSLQPKWFVDLVRYIRPTGTDILQFPFGHRSKQAPHAKTLAPDSEQRNKLPRDGKYWTSARPPLEASLFMRANTAQRLNPRHACPLREMAPTPFRSAPSRNIP